MTPDGNFYEVEAFLGSGNSFEKQKTLAGFLLKIEGGALRAERFNANLSTTKWS